MSKNNTHRPLRQGLSLSFTTTLTSDRSNEGKGKGRSSRETFVNAISIIQRGETWAESFERQRPNAPSEIIPGLYIGNIKTAAAYLLGEVDGDDEFPRITRMVTILSDNHHTIGIDRFSKPCGSGKDIQRTII